MVVFLPLFRSPILREPMSRQMLLGLFLVAAGLGQCSPILAQGLIWNAPDEGTEVQFEGDYLQKDERPNDAEKRISLEWRRRLWIKALKKTKAEYNGNTVDCQWFGIKVVTASLEAGKETTGDLVPGPGGKRIYKVLVPLERATIGPPIAGKVVDPVGIPIAYLPIVKGFRRIDEQAAQPITSGVLDAFPMLTLMANYRTLDVVSEEEDPQVSVSGVSTATHYHGEQIMESPTNRSTNKAEIWANNSIPFGLAHWIVDIVRETKDGKAARDQFQTASTFRVDMKLVKQSTNATSDLQEE
jgi:hypothetical protein